MLIRRTFVKHLGLLAASAPSYPLRAALQHGGLRLGLNTYSLRALTADEALPAVLQVMRETDLTDCQLWSRHVEPARFNLPLPPPGPDGKRAPLTEQEQEQRRALGVQLSEWRLTVPLTFFADIRSRFHGNGLRIRSYSAPLGGSEAEIDRQFLMAKALGAEALLSRVPEPLTAAVAAAAKRHRLPVGLQFSDPEVLRRQMLASRYLRADPDIGDLTKAKVDALQFVKDEYPMFVALDLKDAAFGGASVPFGEGDSRMEKVLHFLRDKRTDLTAYIDCDYPGTGRSTEEVKRCVAYVRRLLA